MRTTRRGSISRPPPPGRPLLHAGSSSLEPRRTRHILGGNQGRVWNGYAAYRTCNLVEALEIFRVYYSFCQCGDDKMTPAMRPGLASGPVAVEDNLNFLPAAKDVWTRKNPSLAVSG
jgi:hypothetical protein